MVKMIIIAKLSKKKKLHPVLASYQQLLISFHMSQPNLLTIRILNLVNLILQIKHKPTGICNKYVLLNTHTSTKLSIVFLNCTVLASGVTILNAF